MTGFLPPASAWRPIGGGSICEVWEADLDDGRAVVIKRTPYPAQVEADGLLALAAAGAPTPAVVDADGEWLVLEKVAGPPDWDGLGRGLARLHADTGEAFGWHRDNLIGSLPQDNTETTDWPAFYVERRIAPFIGASPSPPGGPGAGAGLDAAALPDEVRRRLAAACAGPLPELLGHGPPASLIHGDLWNGNVVGGRWLIDPAVCRADRELELAFMDLFGGFPRALWDAYAAEWPLPEGWQQRRPALQLYHLLVHVRLFGAGYVRAVTSRLDALGW